MQKKIKIKYLRDIQPVTIISNGDWIDLRAAEEVYIEQGKFDFIPLGVAMELPSAAVLLSAASEKMNSSSSSMLRPTKLRFT